MKNYFRYSLGIALLILLAGCNKTSTDDAAPDTNNNPNNNPNNTTTEVLMPLKVGNSWTYKRTRYDEQGSKLDSGNFTVTVTGTTYADNDTWYITSAGDTLSNRADGLWQYKAKKAELLFKYPAVMGDQYTLANGSGNEERRVMNTQAEASVARGKFTTVKYSATHTYLSGYYYVAPKTGLVLQEEISQTLSGNVDYIKSRTELVQCSFR